MRRWKLSVLFFAQHGYFAGRLSATTSTINTESARAILGAIQEGSAMYVEDTSQLPQSKSAAAVPIHSNIRDGSQQLRASATLLELSIVGLQRELPVAFRDV